MFSTRKHIIINLSSSTYRFDRGCWHYFAFLSLSIPFSCLVFAILNLWYSSWLNFISSIEESQPSQSSHLVATFWLDWMAQLLAHLKHFPPVWNEQVPFISSQPLYLSFKDWPQFCQLSFKEPHLLYWFKSKVQSWSSESQKHFIVLAAFQSSFFYFTNFCS